MFVVNFDFSTYGFFQKLAAINIPVVITELVTYPLQRLQTQLIKRPNLATKNQLTQIPYLLKQMFKVQGFPKCFHGLRYSLDYSITLMTFKFFVFDHLMLTDLAESNRYALYFSCVLANAISTIASQSAFNYQTIASSLQTSASNTTEKVKQKLIKFTQSKSAFKNGLKYTLPISLVLTILKLQGMFAGTPIFDPQNQVAPPKTGYNREQLIIASIVLGLTSTTNHFAVQRQIELCFDIKTRFKYLKGLTGTLLRNMGKGMLLYCIYFQYFDWLTQKEIENQFQKRQVHNILPSYHKGRNIQ